VGTTEEILEAPRRFNQPKENSASSSPGSAPPPRSSPAASVARARPPFGSLTQLPTIRLGKRTDNRTPRIKGFRAPRASISASSDRDLHETPTARRMLGLEEHLSLVKDELSRIQPMAAAFYPEHVKRLHGTHVKQGKNKADMVEALREDIRSFKQRSGASRLVAVWCGSTEIYFPPGDVHQTVARFEKGLVENDPGIANSQMYAWACIKEGVPYANGAPNLTVDFPAAFELAKEHKVPIAGKDFKTGQTWMKTVVAPGLKARMLGLSGWFSTNILGNRDGEVLDDPDSFKSKEVSKLGALEYIFQPKLYQDLYGKIFHKVRIEYYPPRGDAKEGWDNLDIFGWLGYPMQIKINFLCRDSILAAPIVLDLALFMDLAKRARFNGVQEWLSFYFKSPMTAPNLYPEHDLFIQSMKLKNTLRWMMGEELITHLGNEYYD
jgi:myo-inositol-1-phosphate synthase